jgi:hypothetical protein
MNKKEIVQHIRTEAGDIEAIVKKLQYRSERLRWLADVLETEGQPPVDQNQKPVPESKFRKLIEKVYGE